MKNGESATSNRVSTLFLEQAAKAVSKSRSLPAFETTMSLLPDGASRRLHFYQLVGGFRTVWVHEQGYHGSGGHQFAQQLEPLWR